MQNFLVNMFLKKEYQLGYHDKSITSHLLITRIFSLCPSLIDDYMQTLLKVLNSCMRITMV